MGFDFIRDHAGGWPVRLMCRVLEVAARSFTVGAVRATCRDLRSCRFESDHPYQFRRADLTASAPGQLQPEPALAVRWRGSGRARAVGGVIP